MLDRSKTNDLNLTVLRRIDSNIEEVLASASAVCFYRMSVEDQQWVSLKGACKHPADSMDQHRLSGHTEQLECHFVRSRWVSEAAFNTSQAGAAGYRKGSKLPDPQQQPLTALTLMAVVWRLAAKEEHRRVSLPYQAQNTTTFSDASAQ